MNEYEEKLAASGIHLASQPGAPEILSNSEVTPASEALKVVDPGNRARNRNDGETTASMSEFVDAGCRPGERAEQDDTVTEAPSGDVDGGCRAPPN